MERRPIDRAHENTRTTHDRQLPQGWVTDGETRKPPHPSDEEAFGSIPRTLQAEHAFRRGNLPLSCAIVKQGRNDCRAADSTSITGGNVTCVCTASVCVRPHMFRSIISEIAEEYAGPGPHLLQEETEVGGGACHKRVKRYRVNVGTCSQGRARISLLM
jgi:hypothetical protein